MKHNNLITITTGLVGLGFIASAQASELNTQGPINLTQEKAQVLSVANEAKVIKVAALSSDKQANAQSKASKTKSKSKNKSKSKSKQKNMSQ